jgi:macrolide phosphotransferase
MTSPSPASGSDEHASIFELALRHGLELAGRVEINELGLDFRIASAVDALGLPWVLRIPRRPDMTGKIQREAAILALLRPRLPFAVPDWRIVSDELIAYPKLTDPTAISVDAATHDMTWHIDTESDAFTRSLGGRWPPCTAWPPPSWPRAACGHRRPGRRATKSRRYFDRTLEMPVA